MALRVKCSCSDQLFPNVAAWKSHYEKNKPSDLRLRMKYANEHITDLVNDSPYVSPHGDNAVQRVNREEGSTFDKLRRNDIKMRALREELMMLEIEQDRLLRETIVTGQSVVTVAEWTVSDVVGTCKACGRKTKWMLKRVYHCHGECKVERQAVRSSNVIEGDLADQLMAIFESEE